MTRQLAVVEPSGAPDATALERNLGDLSRRGFRLQRFGYPENAGHRLRRAGVAARAALLQQAIVDHRLILCARGGYGAGDLLERLDWGHLAGLEPRLVAGFSDISALHSALYSRLGWQSLHGPMPGSRLWRPGGEDIEALVAVLEAWPGSCCGRLALDCGTVAHAVRGTLFGGCLSVLSDLLGTSYFPRSLAGHVVFLEDVNETLPRLLRTLNRWIQLGALEGAEALVFGRFVHPDPTEAALLGELPAFVAERTGIPVFQSHDFGHVSGNMPLLLGAPCEIADGSLAWNHCPAAGPE